MPSSRTAAPLVSVALATAVVLGGCGSSEDAAAPAEPNGQVVEVQALDNSFNPKTVTIEAGTEVRWDNRGRNDHNIIPEDEDAEWRVDLEEFAPGDTASYVFTEPGTYRYYCSIHGTIDVGMPGVVIVE